MGELAYLTLEELMRLEYFFCISLSLALRDGPLGLCCRSLGTRDR